MCQNKNTITGTYNKDQVSIPGISLKVCDLDYINRITRGNKKSADKLIEIFFEEINEALISLQLGIEKTNYSAISNIAHKMRSAFAIHGVTILEPVIKEMEQLSIQSSSIERIRQLSLRINFVFSQAKIEMKLIS